MSATFTGRESDIVYIALSDMVREDDKFVARQLARATEYPAGSEERRDCLARAARFSEDADAAAVLAKRVVPSYTRDEVPL